MDFITARIEKLEQDIQADVNKVKGLLEDFDVNTLEASEIESTLAAAFLHVRKAHLTSTALEELDKQFSKMVNERG